MRRRLLPRFLLDAELAAETLRTSLNALGVPLADPPVAALWRYVLELDKWNATYDLTAVASIEDMLYRHVLDSLAIWPHLPRGDLIDLGSGAGLPGIPLAIVEPTLQITLIEPLGKRARFLNHVVRTLKLGNVAVFNGRAEQWAGPTVALVSARAVAALPQLAAWSRPLLHAGGVLLAMKGPKVHDERVVPIEGFSAPELIALDVPRASGERWLVKLRRLP
jgi:16S rRNA (guanine527-N7)-methyltransferase